MTAPASPYGDSTPDAHSPGPWSVKLPPATGWPASNGDCRINIVDTNGLSVGYVHPLRDPTISEANARLIAAAPATAAERDRLKVVNEGLAKVLEEMRADFCSRHCINLDGVHFEECEVARAALANARKPKSPEGVGG